MIRNSVFSRSAHFAIALSTVACGSGQSQSKDPNQVDTGGAANAGGSGGSGGGATTKGGGTGQGGGGRPPLNSGPFVPPECSKDSTMARPASAPKLEPGVWTNISPKDVPFAPDNGSFTQGMTIDPCNPATLYVCVVSFNDKATNGLWRTLDAGSTWTHLGPFETPIRVRVNPTDPKHLFVVDGVTGNTSGFYVSKDGGQNFAIPESFRALVKGGLIFDTYHVATDPTDFNHLLVTFHNGWTAPEYNGNSGIIESFDGGEKWIIHPPVNTKWAGGYNVFFLYDTEKGVGDSNTWLFGTQGDGYWRTKDAGANWKKVSEVSMDHGGGAVYYAPDGALYVSGTPSLLRSDDNGETFTPLTPTQFTSFLTVAGLDMQVFSQPHNAGKVRTASIDAPTVWSDLGGDPPVFNQSGSFEMAVDSRNRILYNAALGSGVWAMQLP